MKKITVRQFQREFYRSIKKFPVCITRNGKPWLWIYDKEQNIMVSNAVKVGKAINKQLKAHALKSHANAVVGLNYQLTPLPSQYGTLTNRYRLTCTGNLVWINKI